MPGSRRWMLALLAAAQIMTAAAAARAETLFDQLGGKPGIVRLTSDAIDAYMADPRLHAYLDNINPAWLKPRLAAHLCSVLGGGCHYPGRDMRSAHRGLHIDQSAFDVVVEDLQAVMDHDGIGFHTQNRLLALLAPMEHDIVTR